MPRKINRTAAAVSTSAQDVLDAGPREYVNVHNSGSTVVYLATGEDAQASTSFLSLVPGDTITLRTEERISAIVSSGSGSLVLLWG